jgi:hypothetical protein
MSDEDIGRLIRELPRATASTGFSQRVLQKLDDASGRRRARRRHFVLAITAAAVLAGLVSQDHLRRRLERSRALERVQALRDEYQELQREVEKLRALAREADPVLELGGTERVDFVFDLRELADEPDTEAERPRTESVSQRRRRQ